MIKTEDFTKPVTALLAEAFGVLDSSDVFFLDSGRDGLLGTVDGLGADLASRSLGPGRETIASHCGHVLYLLQLFDAYDQGQTPQPDWPGSWATHDVNEAAWRTLRADLRSAYETVAARLQGGPWPEPRVAASIILVTHCAFHIGQIRMLLTALTL
jgi:hypothetical protein